MRLRKPLVCDWRRQWLERKHPYLEPDPALDVERAQTRRHPAAWVRRIVVEEQIDYVQSLWDRIATARGEVPVPEWHREVIDERVKDYRSNPDSGESWDVVRDRLRDELTSGDSADAHPRRQTRRCYHRPTQMPSEPTFPEWWSWELSFTAHAELRMEQRGVTEVDVRAMLERATRYEPSVVEGRFMIHAVHQERPWIVIVEPDADAKLLVVVTPYEVFQ